MFYLLFLAGDLILCMILLGLCFLLGFFRLGCMLDLDMVRIELDGGCVELIVLLFRCFVVLVGNLFRLVARILHLSVSMMGFALPMFILH